jgi:hypothetical protein
MSKFSIEDAIRIASQEVSTIDGIDYSLGQASQMPNSDFRVVFHNKTPRRVGDSLIFRFNANGELLRIEGGY